MTTLVYDRRIKTIGVDSRNTDDAGQTFTCDKIERISGGRFFLGSGHCYTIGLARQWADKNFHPEEWPDFDVLFGDKAEDYGMSCLIISADGEKVTLIDSEMTPFVVTDTIVATGSGGVAAKAAILAGASVERAVEIAIACDINSGYPVQTWVIGGLNNAMSSTA